MEDGDSVALAQLMVPLVVPLNLFLMVALVDNLNLFHMMVALVVPLNLFLSMYTFRLSRGSLLICSRIDWNTVCPLLSRRLVNLLKKN